MIGLLLVDGMNIIGMASIRDVIASVGILVLGAFVAGSRDLSFNLQGYMVVLLLNLQGKTSGLNSFGLRDVMV